MPLNARLLSLFMYAPAPNKRINPPSITDNPAAQDPCDRPLPSGH